MAVMTGVVGALSAFYHDAMDFSDAEHRNISFNRLSPRCRPSSPWPTSTTPAAVHVSGQRPGLHRQLHAHDVRQPVREVRAESGAGPRAGRIFTLHADHEQNASTSTVRLAGSSGANPFACIAAGIACLWGPAHGGANEACLQMLEEIGDVSRVGEYIKRQGQERQLQADGLRSPRLQELRPARQADAQGLQRSAGELGLENDRLFKLAMELEKIALEDVLRREEALPERGLLLRHRAEGLGIPTEMFTCIFALARTVGWMTQWEEMITDPEYKIGRPRQLYIGAARRDVKPLAQRG
jgi:citrate synthase